MSASPVAAPHLMAISPPIAAAGDVVTLIGRHLPVRQGGWHVSFSDGGTTWGTPGAGGGLTLRSWSPTAIEFVVPEPGGADGACPLVPGSAASVVITDGFTSSNPITLRITAPPRICTTSASSAGPGTAVVVTGRFFGSAQGPGYLHLADNGVAWGGPGGAAALSLISWSDTQIGFVVPEKDHAGRRTTPGTTATIVVVNAAGLGSDPVELAMTTDARWPVCCDSGDTSVGRAGEAHMRTTVTIQRSGLLSASTHIWDTSAGAQVNGVAIVAIFDEDDAVLGTFTGGPYRIGGGRSTHESIWTAKLTPTQIATISKVAVCHERNPRYAFPADVLRWVEDNYRTIIAGAEAVVVAV